jgi:CheY-like chemotaxis protein
MTAAIRLFLLNEFSSYREEILGGLAEAGLEPEAYQVADKTDFLEKLRVHKPHVVIIRVGAQPQPEETAFQFHYVQAHNWLVEQDLTIPIWALVNPEDEAIAIDALYKGLADYFFTDRLSRLGPVAAQLAGQEEHPLELIDLNRIVEDYLDQAEVAKDLGGIRPPFLPGAGLPGVLGDKALLTQAVFAIFKNTVATAPQKSTSSTRTYLTAVKGEVCLEIKLSGEAFKTGTENELRALIKKSFDLTRPERIVEKHFGRIDIDQGEDADIRICVSFPAVLDKQVKGSYKLLVVENSQLMRAILKEALEHEGFKVVAAEDGAIALEIMADYQPDLIISDVLMPTMDGFAFFDAVRERPQWQDIPFIFVTGQSGQRAELNTRALRGASYLIKPIIIEELLVAVQSRLPS